MGAIPCKRERIVSEEYVVVACDGCATEAESPVRYFFGKSEDLAVPPYGWCTLWEQVSRNQTKVRGYLCGDCVGRAVRR